MHGIDWRAALRVFVVNKRSFLRLSCFITTGSQHGLRGTNVYLVPLCHSFSECFLRIKMVQPFSRPNTDTAWKKYYFISFGLVWFVGFYGISTFVGYLTPNPFLSKSNFFKSTQFNGQIHFYFKLFKQLYVTIQLSVNTVLMSKTVLFQIILLSISTQFKCKYG